MRRLGPFVALHVACVSLFCLLLWQLARRVAFPWDLMVWSESPFMTNMLKLQAGAPLYGPPSEASSFVYGPALDYLTYGLLRPFGLALDVRACRVINVLVGMAAAAAAAAAVGRVAQRGRVLIVMLFVVFALVIFKSFTADVPHPDNLHLLHLTLTFYLGLRALEHGSFGWALAAVALGGLGLLVKQPAAGTALGVFVAFALSGRWSRSRLFGLASVAALSSGLSAALLLVPEHSRFWTFELLLSHPIEQKLQAFFSDVHFAPHRLLLWALGAWGLTRWWRAGERAALTLLVALGVTSAAPSLAAYFKAMGAWNNLTVMDVWFALCAAPHLCRVLGETTSFEAPGPAASRAADVVVGALLLVTLVPTRMAPTREHYRYAHQLEAAVHADLAAGRRVLVAHGAMFHIRAGHREPLLDRANSILELAYGGFAELADTRVRLERHDYDRVYVNSFWYDGSVTQTLSRAYRSEHGIAGVVPPFTEYRWGWQHLTPNVGVLSPRTRRSSDPRARRAR